MSIRHGIFLLFGLLAPAASTDSLSAEAPRTVGNGAAGAMVRQIAADIARCESVLQRHRADADLVAPADVSPDEPGILRRAETTLRLAELLQARWHVTIGAAELQREFERMRRDSRRPAWLEEMIAALDHDAVRVARALVAPALVTRLAWERFAAEGGTEVDWAEFVAREAPPVGDQRLLAAGWHVNFAPPSVSAGGTLSQLPGTDSPSAPGWRSGGLMADSGGFEIYGGGWTGSRYLMWDGLAPWIYDPATDVWRFGSTVNSPPQTVGPAVQVAGSRLFVWGGLDPYRSTAPVTAGGLYDPVSDSWVSVSNAGPATRSPVTIWTGSQVIGLGGNLYVQGSFSACECNFFPFTADTTFWAYTPATNSWLTNLPLPPVGINTNLPVAWTGTEMLIWGGRHDTTSCPPDPLMNIRVSNSGAAYNPTTRTWRTISSASGLLARGDHAGVWTGTEWMIWGGRDYNANNNYFDGALYNPTTDSWRPVPSAGAPAISNATLVWSGTEVLLRGVDTSGNAEAGARFNPANNTWSPLATPPFATGRQAAWIGTEALYLRRTHGGRYKPLSNSWTEVRSLGTCVQGCNGGVVEFTGTDLLVWGAGSSIGTGSRFNIATATWTPMSTVGAPTARSFANSAWSGTELLIHGGVDAAGGRYNPATDSWRPMSRIGEADINITRHGFWTGSEFIVWNGSGARYNPVSDSWTPMRSNGAPSSTDFVIWTGSRLMAWKAGDRCAPLQPVVPAKGSLYDPSKDLWSPVSRVDNYSEQSAGVWAGHEAVRLGGFERQYDGHSCELRKAYFTSSSLYDPNTNSWSTPSGTLYGAAGAHHVWDGSGIFREGGSFYEFFCTDHLGGARYREITLRDRARLDLVTGTATTVLGSSPLPSSTNLRIFWTGQEELEYEPNSALGAFYNPGFDPNADADGDSFARSVDCDDADPTIHPGATEICDFRDNDCDGSVDEAGDVDRDGDGWGACSSDCNDFDAATHPGAPELCNGIDENCNGIADDNANVDADGDGHFSCTGDCNDNNPNIYPGAPELCNGVDDNCNGITDDNAGVDLDGDGHFSCTDDCNDNNPNIYPGAPELCNGVDDNCNGITDDNAGVDADADSHSSCNDDCNDNDSAVWKKPTFISSLRVSGKTVSVIAWDDMKPAWGRSSVYDVLRGRISHLRSTRNFSLATCKANNLATNSTNDSTTVPLGDALYFTSRGQNTCGTGTFGTPLADSTGTACP